MKLTIEYCTGEVVDIAVGGRDAALRELQERCPNDQLHFVSRWAGHTLPMGASGLMANYFSITDDATADTGDAAIDAEFRVVCGSDGRGYKGRD